jgi:hypothetical protein
MGWIDDGCDGMEEHSIETETAIHQRIDFNLGYTKSFFFSLDPFVKKHSFHHEDHVAPDNSLGCTMPGLPIHVQAQDANQRSKLGESQGEVWRQE